jgi:hypothetical protein
MLALGGADSIAMELPCKRVTAGPTRALVTVALLVVLVVLSGVTVAPRAAAAPDGAGGEGPAPAGVWPLPPGPDQVLRGFDPPSCTWCAGHRGVDLAGSAGATVRAVSAGTVSYAGPLAGRGIVVVDDGTERTEYEPVTPVVRRGESVRAGEFLGRLAVVGAHCAPTCLQDADDVYLDPLSLLPGIARPVRLLPLAPGMLSTPAPRPFGSAPWTLRTVDLRTGPEQIVAAGGMIARSD